MVLRSRSEARSRHNGAVSKSCAKLAGHRSCTSMGGAVWSLHSRRRQEVCVYGGPYRAQPHNAYL